MQTLPLVDLPQTDESSIVYFARTELISPRPPEDEFKKLREEVRDSARVLALLAGRDSDGRIPFSPYKKWHGAHWVLTMLGELGYPPGDESLAPLARQEIDWLSSPERTEWITSRTRTAGGFPTRVCGSMEGNGLLALLRLGLLPDETTRLAEALMGWQWPDGGWNCDKRPGAHQSSFMETLIPMHALHVYAQASGDKRAAAAVDRAAEVFLSRSLFRSRSTGAVIDPKWMELHYPCYWHYDVLAGLVVMREIGRLDDPRCKEALEYLRSRRLPGGGWPADARYYQKLPSGSDYSPVDWGPCGKTRANPWVTLCALRVLAPS